MRERKTGNRRPLWQGVKATAKAIYSKDWNTSWKAGISIGGILFAILTSLIQSGIVTLRNDHEALKTRYEMLQIEYSKSDAAQLRKEVDDIKAQNAVLQNAANLQNAQLVVVTSRVEGCEKRIHEYEQERETVHNEAKKLPPSDSQKKILDLTRKKIGRAEDIPRAEDLKPYADHHLPSFPDARYFWRN